MSSVRDMFDQALALEKGQELKAKMEWRQANSLRVLLYREKKKFSEVDHDMAEEIYIRVNKIKEVSIEGEPMAWLVIGKQPPFQFEKVQVSQVS